MKYGPVSLDRYFSLLPKSDADEQNSRSIWSDQKRTGWLEVITFNYNRAVFAQARILG